MSETETAACVFCKIARKEIPVQPAYEDAEFIAFVRQHHISYPVLRDVSGNFLRSWGVDGVPETFVMNRRGRIVALRRFQLAGTWLQRTVAPLLSARS